MSFTGVQVYRSTLALNVLQVWVGFLSHVIKRKMEVALMRISTSFQMLSAQVSEVAVNFRHTHVEQNREICSSAAGDRRDFFTEQSTAERELH